MEYLLIGNGINIQYGGNRFSNKEIVKRVVTSVDDPSFPLEATTLTDRLQPLWLIGTLFQEIPSVLNGQFDEFASASFEQDALRSFKRRYANFDSNPSPLHVGMEDYFFLLDMFFKKNGIGNTEAHAIRESLKRVFAYAIYDGGNLEFIYSKFPPALKDYFEKFGIIFTTNYDMNIELFSQKTVCHLHGCFGTLSYIYDKDSFRNQLSDDPMSSILFDPDHSYMFSNAVFSYSGALKEFEITQASKTNEALDKFVYAYRTDKVIREDIEGWQHSEDALTRRLAESIILKASHPQLKFEEYYPIKKLQLAAGSLSIVGLSPNNDNHIFELLRSNSKLDPVTYYYHSPDDLDNVGKLLGHDRIVSFVDVRDLWSKYE